MMLIYRFIAGSLVLIGLIFNFIVLLQQRCDIHADTYMG